MRGLYLVSVWLHILAAMTWVGGMVIFVAAVIPLLRRQDPAVRAASIAWFGRRFRAVSWMCFGVLAVTGLLNLWLRGVRVDDVWRPEWHATTFGHLILAKLALVALAVTMSVVHERLAPADRPGPYGRHREAQRGQSVAPRVRYAAAQPLTCMTPVMGWVPLRR